MFPPNRQQIRCLGCDGEPEVRAGIECADECCGNTGRSDAIAWNCRRRVRVITQRIVEAEGSQERAGASSALPSQAIHIGSGNDLNVLVGEVASVRNEIDVEIARMPVERAAIGRVE